MTNGRGLGALPRSRTCFLAAATAAADTEGARQVWRAAQAAGEPRWYLDLIAAIGRAKSETRPPAVAA